MQRGADVVVIGAGVVGLACAAALARAGHRVVSIEGARRVGQGTTARSSEVIHAGLYYPTGSLKAELCVAGRDALVARCAARRVPHRITGKWVVATAPHEVAALEALLARGTANGVPDLCWVEPGDLRRLEPGVRAEAALLSPGSGIVDSAALCLDLLAEAAEHGAVLVAGCRVESLVRASYGWRVAARGPDGVLSSVDCTAVVNAAGLASDTVAALAGIDIDALGWRLHPCKGEYFALAPGASLSLDRLLYPVPPTAGLGIHATLDLAGGVRFGPDATYVDRIDYLVDPSKAETFAAAVRRYLPEVHADALVPAYAGVRPRLAAPGETFRDFVIAEGVGAPGLINCIGIESPGLTAALAIGDRVAESCRAL